MTSTVLDFYKKVLTSFQYRFDEEGLISTMTPTGATTPAKVDGKRLVLPTPEWLNRGFGEDYQPFHPLSESIARRGTSPVLQHMQRNAKAILAHYVLFLAEQLLNVAADRSLHKDLPPDCTDFLKKLSDADQKTTLPLFKKVVQAAVKKNKFITVYLKNGGTYQGKKVNRLAVIRFPIIEALDSEDKDVLGVEVRPKQRKVLSNLFRLVMPFGDSPEEYSAGSNNRVAPYLHAFLQAYLKAATQLNRIISRYAKPMQMPITEFALYQESELEDLAKYHDQIPSLKGNEGGVDESPEDGVSEAASTKPAVQAPVAQVQQAPQVQQAVQQPAPQITVANTPPPAAPAQPMRRHDDKPAGISLSEVLGAVMPQQQQMMQQPMNPYGMPQQQQPWQPVQIFPQAQPVYQQQPANPFAMAVMQAHPQQQQPMMQPQMQPMMQQQMYQQPQMQMQQPMQQGNMFYQQPMQANPAGTLM